MTYGKTWYLLLVFRAPWEIRHKCGDKKNLDKLLCYMLFRMC